MKNVEEYPEELEPYAQELNKVNQELGTEYVFDFSNYSSDELQECVNFYTDMSINEFYTYATNNIIEMEEILSDDVTLIPISDTNNVNEMLNDSILGSRSTRSIQSWYYNGTTSGNNVRIATMVYYINNVAYYDDNYQINIVANNHVTTSSAYFEVTSISNVVYQTDKRSIIMNMNGIKHPIKGTAYSFTKTVSFDAGTSYISGSIGNY